MRKTIATVLAGVVLLAATACAVDTPGTVDHRTGKRLYVNLDAGGTHVIKAHWKRWKACQTGARWPTCSER